MENLGNDCYSKVIDQLVQAQTGKLKSEMLDLDICSSAQIFLTGVKGAHSKGARGGNRTFTAEIKVWML